MLRPLLALCLLACLSTCLNASDQRFTVIELFTSEGCSSCPPADKLLNQVVSNARSNNQPVYALAFHVDYWDKLKTAHGVWKDSYSNIAYTSYQKMYAQRNPMPDRKDMIFTPQILVDGDHIKDGKLDIDELLAQKRTFSISTSVKRKDDVMVISYSCNDLPEMPHLCVALVERGLHSKITAGENAGKELDHENVVRNFHRAATKKEGSVSLQIPEGVKMENCSVISYVQNGKNMHIKAAHKVDAKNITVSQEPLDVPVCEDGICAIPIEALDNADNDQQKKTSEPDVSDGMPLPE